METRQKDGTVWHAGELEVQRRAGVLEEARQMQRGIMASLPGPAAKFLAEQQLAVFSSRDSQGQIWATPRFGPAGFITVIDPFTIQLAAAAGPDLLAEDIKNEPDAGMVVIDLAHRRRVRLNGEAVSNPDGSITLHLKQVYSNCPRYIQERTVPETKAGNTNPGVEKQSPELSDAHKEWIARADTFFIATAHPSYGLDASHRGGSSGFVHVEGPRQLAFPDYDGNKMFTSLGNIVAEPHTGLLFPDFTNGSVLMLTGRATVNWDAARAAKFTGAQRVVEYEVDEVREVEGALPQGWELKSYSPYNP